MRIWADILTPKQLLFAEAAVARLGRRHEVLCTTRRYGEVSGLARVRGVPLESIGRHGGGSQAGKLAAGAARTGLLARRIAAFEPDVAVSFCSPEAARVAFGLGIRHVAMTDSPNAEAVMRLTLPLVQRLLAPSIIPRAAFTRFGIAAADIVQYDAIDAAVTVRRRAAGRGPFRGGGRRILVRAEEEQAAYAGSSRTGEMVSEIARRFPGDEVVVLARYAGQAARLRRAGGGGVRVARMSFDGRAALGEADVFVGSGGTMTAEAALMGVPTVSYNAVPNPVERYLVRERLVSRATGPAAVAARVARMLGEDGGPRRRRAARVLAGMEDPVAALERAVLGRG